MYPDSGGMSDMCEIADSLSSIIVLYLRSRTTSAGIPSSSVLVEYGILLRVDSIV